MKANLQYPPEIQKGVDKLLDMFPDAFIQDYGREIVLNPKCNAYIRVDNVRTLLELDYKVLSCLSYFTAEHHYKRTSATSRWAENRLDRWFHHIFTYAELQDIYKPLGNCCNMQLGMAYISSGFSMEVLKNG